MDLLKQNNLGEYFIQLLKGYFFCCFFFKRNNRNISQAAPSSAQGIRMPVCCTAMKLLIASLYVFYQYGVLPEIVPCYEVHIWVILFFFLVELRIWIWRRLRKESIIRNWEQQDYLGIRMRISTNWKANIRRSGAPRESWKKFRDKTPRGLVGQSS